MSKEDFFIKPMDIGEPYDVQSLDAVSDSVFLCETELFNNLEDCPTSKICDIVLTAWDKYRNHRRIVVAVSGGADSDILVDLFCALDNESKVKFVFVFPGLEYKATLMHIKDLEQRYGITIKTLAPEENILWCCKVYGQPFCNKNVSEYISRLQRYGFQWEDDSFENLWKKYPKCQTALKWWCDRKGEGSMFSIENNKLLKDFIMAYPPYFMISRMCCVKAKEKPLSDYCDAIGADLSVSGVRKSEGGARAGAYKSCFTSKEDDDDYIDKYRPLFFMTNEDKKAYVQSRRIIHSECYRIYGFKRTGCCCCPFGLFFEDELEAARKYEPDLYKAASKAFQDSITYSKMYRHFKDGKEIPQELLDEFEQNRRTYRNRMGFPFRQQTLFELMEMERNCT